MHVGESSTGHTLTITHTEALKTKRAARIRAARFVCLRSDSNAAAASEDQRNDEKDQEDEEQDFRNSSGAFRDTAEAEDGGDNGNDEEDDGPVQHRFLRG